MMNVTPCASPDKFLIWPVSLTIMFFSTLVLLIGIPGNIGFALGFILGISIPYLVTLWLIICLYFAYRRRWRRTMSIAVILLVIVCLRSPIVYCCQNIHLLIFEPTYEKAIEASESPAGARFAVFDWSVGFAGSSTFLIYDESDAIKSAQAVQSIGAITSGFTDCAGKAEHIRGHYYLCEF